MNSNKNSALLQNKSFRLLIIARISSTLAYQMLTVCIGWVMYSITKSAFYLGLAGLIQFLPILFLSLYVGQLSDRYDRKKLVRISQLLQGILILILAFVSFNGWITKGSLLVLILCIATANCFEGPPSQALLPNIVDRDTFPSASALVSSAWQFSVIVGPCLGGILYSVSSTFVYILAGCMVLLSSVLISKLSIRESERSSEPPTLNSLLGGITFIKSRPIILGAISLDLFAVLFGGATALLPIYAGSILMIGSFGLGVLRAAPAIGAFFMSAFLAKKPLKRNVGRKMLIAVIFFGLATIMFAVSKSIIISFLALVLLGASDIVSVVIRSTLVQLETPDNMRGRVSSVNTIFIGASNQLGEFESGITAFAFGTIPAALIGGIGSILIVLLWTKLFPSLFHVDKFN